MSVCVFIVLNNIYVCLCVYCLKQYLCLSVCVFIVLNNIYVCLYVCLLS